MQQDPSLVTAICQMADFHQQHFVASQNQSHSTLEPCTQMSDIADYQPASAIGQFSKKSNHVITSKRCQHFVSFSKCTYDLYILFQFSPCTHIVKRFPKKH